MPFAALALVSHVAEPSIARPAIFALAAYGAVILSFLGGIRWGLALLSGEAVPTERQLFVRLLLSVLPSLLGWMALLVSPITSLLVLAAGFGAVLALDIQAARSGDAPHWYPRLRVPLSLMVIGSLLTGALA